MSSVQKQQRCWVPFSRVWVGTAGSLFKIFSLLIGLSAVPSFATTDLGIDILSECESLLAQGAPAALLIYDGSLAAAGVHLVFAPLRKALDRLESDGTRTRLLDSYAVTPNTPDRISHLRRAMNYAEAIGDLHRALSNNFRTFHEGKTGSRLGKDSTVKPWEKPLSERLYPPLKPFEPWVEGPSTFRRLQKAAVQAAGVPFFSAAEKAELDAVDFDETPALFASWLREHAALAEQLEVPKSDLYYALAKETHALYPSPIAH
jgi:hypothetical protein